MTPRSSYIGLIVLGFVLILFAFTITLHSPTYDPKMVISFAGIGVFIMLIALWMFNNTGVLGVEKPYHYLASTTLFSVLGFILILVMITLRLMGSPVDQKVLTILLALGLFFLFLGFLVNLGDRHIIRNNSLKDA